MTLRFGSAPPPDEVRRDRFHILVIAPLRASDFEAMDGPWAEPLRFERATFDETMAEVAPAVAIDVPNPVDPRGKPVRAELKFSAMRAFRPDVLLAEVPLLRALVANAPPPNKPARSLVDDILLVARIDSQVLQYEDEDFDLTELLAETVEELTVTSAGARIELDDGAGRHLRAHGDSMRYRQVLTNLLANAIRFSPEGEAVHVSVVAQDGHARVAVQDHGPGIAEADQPRLFQRFSQVGPPDERGHRARPVHLPLLRRGPGRDRRLRDRRARSDAALTPRHRPPTAARVHSGAPALP